MNDVLLIPLAGPMQSWGTRSRFQERDTEREPTKSGVIGILCAALGRDRAEPVADLAELKMGVRVDQEGLLQKDFQTAQHVAIADTKGTNDQISSRYYLSDAVFLVGLEGESNLIQKLHESLSNPVWPFFLGRKSYIPSLPLYLPDGIQPKTHLRDALMSYPLFVSCKNTSKKDEKIRMVLESATATHETRMDIPVSFQHYQREFRERFVVTEFVSASIFPLKEDEHVSLPIPD